MSSEITREEIAASLAAVEARTDTKFAELRGDMKVIASQLSDIREGQRSSFWGLIAAIGTVGAIIIACLAFGSQWFGLGLDSNAAMDAAAKRAAAAIVEAQQNTAGAEATRDAGVSVGNANPGGAAKPGG